MLDPIGWVVRHYWNRAQSDVRYAQLAAGNALSGSNTFDGPLILGRQSLTIAAGVITVSAPRALLSSETGVTDDLDTINGGVNGALLMLRVASGHTITAKDGTGNLNLAGDCVLDNPTDTLLLVQDGAVWLELARSNNA